MLAPLQTTVRRRDGRCEAVTATLTFAVLVLCAGNGNAHANVTANARNLVVKPARRMDMGICSLPEVFGVCKLPRVRYRFDTYMKRCRLYYDGGCDFTPNSFSTLGKCRKACGRFEKNPCRLPLHSGRKCNTHHPHRAYRFNYEKQTCELFKHNGCGGNGNYFHIEEDCWKICQDQLKSRCFLPISTGKLCKRRSMHEVYGFNKKHGRCEWFVHFGCGGNANYFKTAKQCWNTCGMYSKYKCTTRPAVRQRLVKHKRWWYDIDTDTCRHSAYYWFPGRFRSLAECENACMAPYVPDSSYIDLE